MKRSLILLVLTSLLLAACGGAPVSTETPERATVTATQTEQPTETPTPLPVGTWETVIEGIVYDQSRGPGNPIAGVSVSYNVVHSYFAELQQGRPNQTVTDAQGAFSLPVMVHDTDSIRVRIEAQGFISYEEKLVGVDLFGGRNFDIGLTPLVAAPTSLP